MKRPAALAAALCLLLAAVILAGWTGPFDRAVLASLRVAGRPGIARAAGWLVASAGWLTALGTFPVRLPIAAALAAWSAARGRRRAALALMCAVLGAELLVQLAKAIAARPRPPAGWALVHAHGTSLPSGHAAGAMALFPLVGLFAGTVGGRRAARIGAAAGVVLALLVGATRILLGVHWASDVVDGWLLGGAVALLAAGADRPAAERGGRPPTRSR